MNAPVTPATPRSHAGLLWLLTFLFFLRVAGQILVAFLGVSFLPPMKEWMSGLLPYPALLVSQIAILLFQCRVNCDFSRGRGYFIEPKPRAGRILRVLSFLYAGAMALRYVVTMTLYPERRWAGSGTIPIVFHLVLAAWLYAFARYHVLSAENARARA